MTDKEIMQMALDALFNLRLAASERDKKNRIRQFDEFMDNSDEAIEALRARLAQPIIADEIKDDKTKPAAWIITTELQDGTRLTHPLTGRFEDVQDMCDFGDPIPLYTVPSQREWQGLTDEERGEVALSCGCMTADWLAVAHAIEAKLKEKNNEH